MRSQSEKAPFASRIDWYWWELWHRAGRQARHGASMMAADRTQSRGMYEVARIWYTQFLPELQALAADGLRDAERAAAAKKLSELAKTIRSKNAGVNKITFDIIFRTAEAYETVKRSKAITRETMARLFNIPGERIADFIRLFISQAERAHPRAAPRIEGEHAVTMPRQNIGFIETIAAPTSIRRRDDDRRVIGAGDKIGADRIAIPRF